MAACRKEEEEEKAGMSPTSAAGGGGTAETSAAALNVPTYLPAANMLLGKTLRQFLDRWAREAGAAVPAATSRVSSCAMCSMDSVIDRISPVGQS